LPGYIVSPSSRLVMEQLEKFYNEWTELGSEVYFTNVIGAIQPYGNRYDFHPDAPAPDLYFDQIRKMMQKYGSRMPLFSEGGAAWQMPFQTGFCLHPSWNPEQPGADYWRTPSRGQYVCYRNEPGVFLKNEYIRFYPHNTGTRLGQSSIGQLTFSLLHSLNPKLGIASADRFTAKHRRWLELLSHLGRTAFAKLYGARLINYERSPNGIVLAEYENCQVIGNYSGKEYECGDLVPDSRIVPEGFLFKAENLLIGSFSLFKGAACPEDQIIIVEDGLDTRYNMAPDAVNYIDKAPKISDKSAELLIQIRFKLNSLPQYGNSKGIIPLLITPQTSGENTLELRYNMHYGTLQFLQKYPDYLIGDLTAYDMELLPGKWYNVVIKCGNTPALLINDREYTIPQWYYVHEQVPLRGRPKDIGDWCFSTKFDNWTIGRNLDLTVDFIDIK
jgi:hypothetical protein